ncbi:MAG: YafY family transcriptional regulator [Firmicutes bacterium]|nr:YafY family transcriptional regulator [Bacillota bacterium]
MQIDRMLRILFILLNKKMVTAGELSAELEVSPRTIYRDLDALCQAGIPIYTCQGRNGGIKLVDSFVLNKALLSQEEQNEILAALHGLNAVHYPQAEKVLTKLSAIFGGKLTDWITVDFSGWGPAKEDTLAKIKEAIINRKLLSFTYYNSYGEKTIRTVEPLQLWFKSRAWYLRAFCRNKQDERLFKLNRIKSIRLLPEGFMCHPEKEPPPVSAHGRMVPVVEITMKIHATQAYRVYDEFEESQITPHADGSFTVRFSYPEDEWVYGLILSFGMYAEVIEPPHIREIIKERLRKALAFYE